MNRLMVILGLDSKQFKSGAAAASSYASNFATQLRNSMMSALGPIAAAMAVMGWVKGVFEEAKAIADMSKRFDVSSDSLQRMAIAGKKVGLEMGNIATIIKSFKKGFADAFKNEAAVNDLLALGFTMEEIRSGGIDAQTAILRLSESLDKAGNKTEFMQKLTAAFGRSATDIMAMLSMSTQELNETFRQAAIMSKEQIDAADELGDAWQGIVDILKPVAMIIVGLIGMIAGAIIGIVSSIPMYISAFSSMVMGKMAQLLDWMAGVAEKIPKIGKGLGSALRGAAGAARGVEGIHDSATQFFGKGAQFGMKTAASGFHSMTMGGFKSAPEAKPARRDTDSIVEGAGVATSKGGSSSASYGVSGMAVVGGGGLVGGGYDATVAVARETLTVAKETLTELKTQSDLLKNKTAVSK